MLRVLLAGLSQDRVELNLARSLYAIPGLHLRVLVQSGSRASSWCREYQIPYEEQAFRHRLDPQAITCFRRLLATDKVDVLHCLTNRALSTALWATRRQRHPPRVIAYRGTTGHLHRWDPASRMSYLHPRVDKILCVSGAVKKYLAGLGLPASRLAVIWKGHDPAWYTPADRTTLTSLGVPDGATVVCFVGNIRPVKGVDVLLSAFRKIAPEERIHLLLVGDVRMPRIFRMAEGLPHIHFAGFRRDAAALAGASDLTVMPSRAREGLPKAILEGMAQGVPAVVTSAGGMPELVEHERCGLVVAPGDADQLRQAIRRLATDPALRRQFGAAAKARISGPFHFRETLRATLGVYAQLCPDHTVTEEVLDSSDGAVCCAG